MMADWKLEVQRAPDQELLLAIIAAGVAAADREEQMGCADVADYSAKILACIQKLVKEARDAKK